MADVSSYDTMPKALFEVQVLTLSSFNLATDVSVFGRSGLANSFCSHLCIICRKEINNTFPVFFFEYLLLLPKPSFLSEC